MLLAPQILFFETRSWNAGKSWAQTFWWTNPILDLISLILKLHCLTCAEKPIRKSVQKHWTRNEIEKELRPLASVLLEVVRGGITAILVVESKGKYLRHLLKMVLRAGTPNHQSPSKSYKTSGRLSSRCLNRFLNWWEGRCANKLGLDRSCQRNYACEVIEFNLPWTTLIIVGNYSSAAQRLSCFLARH